MLYSTVSLCTPETSAIQKLSIIYIYIGAVLICSGTSVRYRFGSPFSWKRLWFVDTVLWLCPSLPPETLKWLSSLPTLMQKSFWWWQCSDRYIISLFPHLHTPFHPFSPSLISRTVSVDVKHHVYLLAPGALYIAAPFHFSPCVGFCSWPCVCWGLLTVWHARLHSIWGKCWRTPHPQETSW